MDVRFKPQSVFGLPVSLSLDPNFFCKFSTTNSHFSFVLCHIGIRAQILDLPYSILTFLVLFLTKKSPSTILIHQSFLCYLQLPPSIFLIKNDQEIEKLKNKQIGKNSKKFRKKIEKKEGKSSMEKREMVLKNSRRFQQRSQFLQPQQHH